MERLNLDVVGFYNRYSNLIEDARLIERTPLKQVFIDCEHHARQDLRL